MFLVRRVSSPPMHTFMQESWNLKCWIFQEYEHQQLRVWLYIEVATLKVKIGLGPFILTVTRDEKLVESLHDSWRLSTSFSSRIRSACSSISTSKATGNFERVFCQKQVPSRFHGRNWETRHWRETRLRRDSIFSVKTAKPGWDRALMNCSKCWDRSNFHRDLFGLMITSRYICNILGVTDFLQLLFLVRTFKNKNSLRTIEAEIS